MTTTSPDWSRNASPFLYGPEQAALREVLSSGHYGHTDVTDWFEQEIAAFLEVPETVAVASGTAALHIALLAAGVGAGHEVIVPSFTFCATVQAVVAAGARPRFMDIDPRTLCAGPDEILDALTPHTRAVIPVLYAGRAVDLSGIHAELAERGVVVIEDAAHAFGSHQGTRHVGATGQALTCFSFGPIKNLTCGQGGMIVPRTAGEAEACRRLRGLGVVESADFRADATSYTVDRFGLRAQMSSLNAAIGLAQLAYFPETEARRKDLWRAYASALQGVDGVTLVDVDVDRTVPHLCPVLIPGRDQVFRILRERGIGVGAHYPPCHRQPAFEEWHRPLPVTEKIGREIMTLPFHQHMTAAGVDHVVSELARAISTEGAR